MIFSVTTEGIHSLPLSMLDKISCQPKIVATGDFSGLDIIGKFSDFPLLLTTRKTDVCVHLDILGLHFL